MAQLITCGQPQNWKWGSALSKYTPGEELIIDYWYDSWHDATSVYGTVVDEILGGDENLLDLFANTIDEEWINKLAKVVVVIDGLRDAKLEEDEEYGDQDEE